MQPDEGALNATVPYQLASMHVLGCPSPRRSASWPSLL